MKLKLFFLTILLSTINAISQTNFKLGYIIFNNNTTTECLIKNEDWANNPQTFEYKLSENAEIQIGSVEKIREFGSGESFKYVRATLDVDQSSDVVNNLTADRNPVMKEETVFLKTLVEGKASLYFTDRENNKRYFYKMDDGKIEQLIYKRYLTNQTKIGKNELYKQQLSTIFLCSNFNQSKFENLKYNKNSLIRIFTEYNECSNSNFIIYDREKLKRGYLNLSLRPGITFSSFSLKDVNEENVEFDDKTGIRIGVEIEYILPFRNNKWAVFIEPTYKSSYKSEREIQYINFLTIDKFTTVTVTGSSFEIPIGARHYFYLNDFSSIFLDAALIVDSGFGSEITSSEEFTYQKSSSVNLDLGCGIGYQYNKKLAIQFRLNNDEFNTCSIILSYNFL